MILVTGASGALARSVLERLQHRRDVLAATRQPAALADSPTARLIDFDKPSTLRPAMSGVDTLLLISAGFADDDVVMARHKAAVDAAVDSGVRHVVYTSLVGAGDHMSIALAHRWTERVLANAPLDVTVLRNALYAETLPLSLLAGGPSGPGELRLPWGSGRVSFATRADLASAAAKVLGDADDALTSGGRSPHAGNTYELAGSRSLGGEEIAATFGAVYRSAALTDAWDALSAAELPAYQVAHAMSMLSNIHAGFLDDPITDLHLLVRVDPDAATRVATEHARMRSFT